MFTDIVPIWKNRVIQVPDTYLINGTYVDYKVSVGSSDLYRGRAYRFNNKVEFQINDIAKNYLTGTVDLSFDSDVWQTEQNGSVDFDVYVSKDNFITQEKFCTITFWYDWSYEDYLDNHYLSDPISNIADKRQVILFTSMFDSGSVVVTGKDNLQGSYSTIDSTTFSAGQVKTYVKRLGDIKLKGEFTEAFSKDFLVWRYIQDLDEFQLNYNNWRTFRIKDTCNRYCLYYLNARGGWDWLLIDGSYSKKYMYDRLHYKQNYDNTKPEFGKVNYQNDITESWSLNTSWMNDTNSAKMWNLFGSTKVYLHDLVEDKIIPVIITDNNQTEKTFRNQGRKMYNYTINVESAQSKKRL